MYNLWARDFGRDFVIYVNTTKSQISDVVADYDKFMRGSLRYGRLDSGIPFKSLRQLNGECRNMLRLTRRKGRTSKSSKKPHGGATSDSLFDIGRDKKNLRVTENIFYEDPKTYRKFCLSEETDVDYEEEFKVSRQEKHKRVEAERNEEHYANPPDYQEETRKAEPRSMSYLQTLTKSTDIRDGKTNTIFFRYSK